MAATYIVIGTAIANAANKNIIAVQNGTGSGVTMKIRRANLWTGQTGAVSGGVQLLEIGTYSGAYSGGTALTTAIVSMDSNNSALPGQIVAATNCTATISSIYRQVVMFTDEVAVSDATSDMLSLIPPLNTIWDSGYNDSAVQPLTIDAGSGFIIHTATTGGWNTAGTFNVLVEFTVE